MKHIEILSFLYILSIYSSINNAHAHLRGESIIGGEDSNPGEYTYQVLLADIFGRFCGGAIIGNQHVVTAAHCVTDNNGALKHDPIEVVAGVNNLKNKRDPKRVDINVETVYIPKIFNEIQTWNAKQKYQSTKKRTVGDIAVLKLDRPFNLRSHPHLTKLNLGDPSESYARKTAVVTGFGWNYIFTLANDENIGMSYSRLRSAQTTVLSNENCYRLMTGLINRKPISKSHLCAQVVQRIEGEPEGVCLGDSGSPLAYDGDTLIGVVSTSVVDCQENITPAVYTRVSEYLDFIQKAVNNVEDPQILSAPLIISNSLTRIVDWMF